MLCVPREWGHYVYNIEPSISVCSSKVIIKSLAVTCVKESDNLFLNVSEDLVLYVFSFLSFSDMANVSLVCKYLKYLTSRDYLWKYFYECHPFSSLAEQ
jgi:hypothetical protein